MGSFSQRKSNKKNNNPGFIRRGFYNVQALIEHKKDKAVKSNIKSGIKKLGVGTIALGAVGLLNSSLLLSVTIGPLVSLFVGVPALVTVALGAKDINSATRVFKVTASVKEKVQKFKEKKANAPGFKKRIQSLYGHLTSKTLAVVSAVSLTTAFAGVAILGAVGTAMLAPEAAPALHKVATDAMVKLSEILSVSQPTAFFSTMGLSGLAASIGSYVGIKSFKGARNVHKKHVKGEKVNAGSKPSASKPSPTSSLEKGVSQSFKASGNDNTIQERKSASASRIKNRYSVKK